VTYSVPGRPHTVGVEWEQIEAGRLRERVRLHLGELASAVDATRRDAAFGEALEAMARFRPYSLVNQWAIRWQRPTATRVMGRKGWRAVGRDVKPGEAPIWVLAPWRPSEGRFVAVEVFDVRQTRGKRFPELDLLHRGSTRHVATIEGAARTLGVRIGDHLGNDDARAVSLGGEIRIRPGLPRREGLRALVHELAHEILHQEEARRRDSLRRRPPARTHAEEETEADATAHVVLNVLGLPSKSPAYIAWQGGDGATVLRSLSRVQRAVTRILDAAGLQGP